MKTSIIIGKQKLKIMLKEGQRYTISELRQAMKESTSEFKPKLGDGVESGDKKNNREAVKDIEKKSPTTTAVLKSSRDSSTSPQTGTRRQST